jgi:hypothetical protein
MNAGAVFVNSSIPAAGVAQSGEARQQLKFRISGRF